MNWADFAPEFTPEEFDERTAQGAGTGEKFMDLRFVKKLYMMRRILDRPVIITSGYRSKEHDAEITKAAGKPTVTPNAHVDGHAADIACSTSRDRLAIIRAALQVGINRIGVDSQHVHLDDDPACAPEVFWIE